MEVSAKNGNSDILLDRVLQGARSAGVTAEAVQLRDYSFQSCIGCERCRRDLRCTGLQDEMQLMHPKIEEYRGMVAGSPIHGYTVTALMKAFLDRLYSYYDFTEPRPGPVASRLSGQGRKAVIVAVGEQDTYELGGMDSTLVILRRNLDILGFQIVGELPVLGVFEGGEVLKRPEVLKAAEEL
ncbi:flavodoxin family protein [Chloroflexota bacterium]